ncbi:hypothetical protein [Paraburkholderia youngii]|uniref:hypothetical protein n=1 Tax=Paraburkholderia youngii TaxID=2782701 RepID=UPI003D192431
MKLKMFGFVSAAISLSLAIISPGASAQLGVPTAIAAGTEAKDVVDKLQEDARELLNDAQNDGNAMSAQLANTLSVLATNIQNSLGDDINKAYKDLNRSEQDLLNEADAYRVQIDKTTRDVYDIEATTDLDIADRLASLPFVQDKFFVHSISDISMLPGQGQYNMEVIATKLGVQEGRTTTIALFGKDGKQIDDSSPDQSTLIHHATLHIPGSILSPLVAQDKLVLVPATLKITVSEKTGIAGFFGFPTTSKYDVPINLTLYPYQAAVASIAGKIPVSDWTTIPAPPFPSRVTPDGHCDGGCGGSPIKTLRTNHLEYSVPNGERIINARLTCDAPANDPDQPCAFAGYTYYNKDLSKGVAISQDGTKVTADWVTWTHPTQFTLRFDVQKYQQTGEKDFGPVAVPLTWNHVSYFTVPTNYTEATVSVKPYTKNSYDLLVNGQDRSGLVSMKGQGQEISGYDRYAIFVNWPADIH